MIIIIIDATKRAYGPFGSTVLAEEWVERQLNRLGGDDPGVIYTVYEVEAPVELLI